MSPKQGPLKEQPESAAKTKHAVAIIVRILPGIAVLCLILIFHAVRTGKLDVSGIVRNADKTMPSASSDIESLDEYFDRRLDAIVNMPEQIARIQGRLGGNDVERARAAAYFRKVAEQGSPVGRYFLGGMYDKGWGVLQNREKALALYLQAAEQGYVEARNKLGDMYATGDGVPQDRAQAAVWYRMAAEQRSDSAQMKLGILLITGQGVPQDKPQGRDWLQKAVANNNTDAMFVLARLYDMGDGVEQDKKKALDLYLRVADSYEFAGIDAMFALWRMYDTGDGVAQDREKALDWLRQAADGGHAAAEYTLGMLYYHGDGPAEDIHKAARLIQRAAEHGNANARQAMRQDDLTRAHQENLRAEQDARREAFLRRADKEGAAAWYELGKACEEGGHGLPLDKAQAADWYRKAAEHNNTDAMFALARMYDTGDGVAQDKKKALDLYLKVADAHDRTSADAMLALWRKYDTGDGVAQDKKKALDWLLGAAKESHGEAMRRLGLLYAEGSDLVRRDRSLAANLYSKAAEKGDGEASFLLASLLDAGSGVPRNKVKALDLYHKAASLHYPPAEYHLGKLYSRGKEVDPDQEQAAFWFQRAAAQGHAGARAALDALRNGDGPSSRDKAAQQP